MIEFLIILIKAGKLRTSQIRNSQEGLKSGQTFIESLNTLLKARSTFLIITLEGRLYKVDVWPSMHSSLHLGHIPTPGGDTKAAHAKVEPPLDQMVN